MPSDLKIIQLGLIDAPAHAMRDDMSEEALHDLVESIRQNGVITPLTLRPKGERYEVVAGARRRVAAFLAGLTEVPAVVRDTDDRASAVIKMHENLVREDVDPVSEGRFIAESIEQLGYDVEAFAKEINRSIPYIQTRLAINAMPDYLKEGILSGRVSIGVALELMRVDDDAQRRTWTDDAMRSGMTVSTAKYAVAMYEANKAEQQERGGGTQTPPPVMQLPTVLWECAKCGGKDTAEAMTMVRIHRADCPEPVPTVAGEHHS